MRNTIRDWLGITKIEDDVSKIEAKVDSLILTVSKQTKEFGNYKKKTEQELYYMLGCINSLIEQMEDVTLHNCTNDEIERSKSVLRKLKYNKTIIKKTINAKG